MMSTRRQLASLSLLAVAQGETIEDLAAKVVSLQEELARVEVEANTGMTHMWLILCGALVMFMHAGFAMLEAGCCRAGFVQSVLEKNLLNCCVSTFGFWSLGWAFAYGGVPENGFMGSKEFFSIDFAVYNDDGTIVPAGSAPTTTNLNWFFQWAFCMTSATIVSGAVAERLQLGGYCIFCFIMTSFVYPVVVAWTWSCAGWLNYVGAGYYDFAGSGIVHLCGGAGAIVGCKLIGPRTGRYDETVDQGMFEPHNVSLVVLGTIILWFGWYGFNCGSTLAMDGAGSGQLAAQVAVNTTLSPAFAGLLTSFVRRYQTGRWSAVSTCGGILGGLVSITAGCGSVRPFSAVIIGCIGGIVYMVAGDLMVRFKIDDPVEAFPVHGACGMWGVISAALFDWGVPAGYWNGWGGFSPTDGATLGSGFQANIVGLISIFAWSGSLLGITFMSLKMGKFLRIPVEGELEGLDAHEFSPSKGYATADEGLSPKPRGNQVVVATTKVQPVDDSGAATIAQ